jgi:Uncharacterized homolog of plant Iojap protein
MTATPEAVSLARIAAKAGADKLAENAVALDVSEPFGLAEIFLLLSGSNERQIIAIAEEVEEKLSNLVIKRESWRVNSLPAGC